MLRRAWQNRGVWSRADLARERCARSDRHRPPGPPDWLARSRQPQRRPLSRRLARATALWLAVLVLLVGPVGRCLGQAGDARPVGTAESTAPNQAPLPTQPTQPMRRAQVALPMQAVQPAQSDEPGQPTQPVGEDGSAGEAQRVLVLNSYHVGYPWTDGMVEGIRAVLARECERALVYVEYMDTKRFWDGLDGSYAAHLAELYRLKYRHLQPDVIITTDDNALLFLLARRERLFPDVPIVFAGVNNYEPELLAGRPDITGVVEKLDQRATIDLALSLSPEARRVAIITDTSATGLSNRAYLEDLAEEYDRRAEFVFLDETGEGLRLSELLDRLKALPPDSVVLYMDFFRTRTGRFLAPEDVMAKVSAASPVPVYSMGSFYLGKGIVGGKITRSYDQGAVAAGLACRILAGEQASSIPVLAEGATRYMFDYRQLDRFDIPLDALPPGSAVAYRPFSFYREYRPLVWSVAGVGTLLALLLAILTMNLRRRRRAERSLHALFEGVPDALFVYDRQGRLLYCNRVTEERLGYGRDELLGMRMTQVESPIFARSFNERVQTQLTEGSLACEGEHVTRDGEHIPVDINTSLITFQGQRVVLAVARDIRDRQRAEQALRVSEQRFRGIFESAGVGIAQVDRNGSLVRVNQAFCGIFGYPADELIGKPLLTLTHPEDVGAEEELIEQVRAGRIDQYELEKRFLRKDGSTVWVSLHVSVQRTAGHRSGPAICVVNDRTENRRLESQLLQAQKMEAVGRLAGGVAHDFNNKLQTILGFSEILHAEMPADAPGRGELEEIQEAARRSAELTRQLLAFARKQTIDPKVLDLNETVAGMLKMLQRLIGENVELQWQPGDTCRVKVDPAQLDQVLANLVVNARDAIADVGQIVIRTGRKHFDEAFCGENVDCRPGLYAMLAVSDNGVGMDRQTVEQIFEPFFTTKPKEKGTGLGLATVYGIVRQNGGFINVYSEPGAGTTLRIYLPAVDAPETPGQTAAPIDRSKHRGSETILLVEDDPAILQLGRKVLTSLGYEVLAAPGPEEALEISRGRSDGIDLLLTDVVMPRMSGRELWEQISADRPRTRCVFMSGYTADVIANRGVLDEGIEFLQKPFTARDLTAKIRDVLSPAEETSEEPGD